MGSRFTGGTDADASPQFHFLLCHVLCLAKHRGIIASIGIEFRLEHQSQGIHSKLVFILNHLAADVT